MALNPVSEPPSPLAVGSPFGSVDLALHWRDVQYTVGDKEILKGLDGALRPRRALAVMGSSGAGKTTFVNAISDRLAHDKTHIVGGNVTLNGVPYTHEHRRLIGFVPQDDILSEHSTPAEVLAFSLRIRRGTDAAMTDKCVESMLEELQLTKCRNTIVGTPGLEVGLSGGERKRTNIGVELICDPKILLLDEPTSGLDSVTAEKVISLLRELARRGRTVAYTIHQPTSDCFALFDDLMLMVAGKVVYHGPAEDAVQYFTTVGYECPSHYTPSDYFMQLMQDEDIGARLIELWEEHLANTVGQSEKAKQKSAYLRDPDPEALEMTERYLNGFHDAHGASYLVQLMELFKRSGLTQLRNKMQIFAVIGQAVIFGIICALIFVNLQDNVTGVQDRHGLLFMLSANIAFSSVMSTVNSFPPERAVFVRDQQSGAYSPFLYFIAKMVAELPLAVLGTVLTALIVYFPTRLVLDAGAFFAFTAILIVMQQVGAGVGLCISVGIENYQLASGITPVIVMPMILTGGLLASTDRLRPAWVWLEKISFFRHGFVLLERNEFERLHDITCDVADYTADFCSRQPTTGDGVLDTQEFRDGHHKKWLMWFCLAAFFVLARLLAIVLLYVVAHRKN